MASGITLQMRNIRRPAPTVIHRNIGAPRKVRRDRRANDSWKGSYVTNYPYINPARDERPGRKLKGDS